MKERTDSFAELKSMHDKILFLEEPHEYWIDEVQYLSVTTFLKKYFEKFDAEFISNKISRGNELKKARLLYDWFISAPWGTYIHRLLELYCTGIPIDVNLIEPQVIEGIKLIEELKKEGWVIAIPEMRVFHKESKLCGSPDLIMIHKDNPKLIKIVDHKTCNKIPNTGFCCKMCKDPIAYLDDCKEMHYQLQLSVYGYFIRTEFPDYEIDSLELLHVAKDSPGKRIKLDYMEEEAIDLVRHYIENKNGPEN